MCEPISASTMAYLSIASTVATTAASEVAAKTQAKALTQQGQQRSDQLTEQGSLQLGVRARQARVDQGRAEVAGGESGLAGNSYESSINNITQQANMDQGTIALNTKNAQLSNNQDVLATGSRIQQPNYFGSALTIGQQYRTATATPPAGGLQVQ